MSVNRSTVNMGHYNVCKKAKFWKNKIFCRNGTQDTAEEPFSDRLDKASFSPSKPPHDQDTHLPSLATAWVTNNISAKGVKRVMVVTDTRAADVDHDF